MFHDGSIYTALSLIFFIMGEISVASLNLNIAGDSNKRAALFEIIRQKKFDVFVQETHSDATNAVDWASEFDGLLLLSHNTSNSGGVAILFSRNFIPVSFQVEEIIKVF